MTIRKLKAKLQKDYDNLISFGVAKPYTQLSGILSTLKGVLNLLETTHNSEYTKCLDDLYENYPYKEEWDKADIAEFIEKHFA